VEEHETLKRERFDVFSSLTVDIADAVLGEEFHVETVAGKEAVKVRPGTQPGSVIRLRGKGVPRLHRSGRGDHYVRIDVEVPSKLTKREQQLYYELKSISDKSKKGQDLAGKVREALGR
jgi:molecular chaperone DnaJ